MLAQIEKKYPKSCLRLLEKEIDPKNNQHWYEGIVTPISWDQYGYPIKFSLFMNQEEELVLSPLDSSLSIGKFVNRRVVISGEKITDETLCVYKIQIKDENFSGHVLNNKTPVNCDEFQLHVPQFFKYGLMN